MSDSLPKIYLYIKRRSERGDWVIAEALAEDGTSLAERSMSSRKFLLKDFGSLPSYRQHYPRGFEIVDVWDPEKHEGLQGALRRAAA